MKDLPGTGNRETNEWLTSKSNVFDLGVRAGVLQGGISPVGHELLEAVKHHVPSFFHGLTLRYSAGDLGDGGNPPALISRLDEDCDLLVHELIVRLEPFN